MGVDSAILLTVIPRALLPLAAWNSPLAGEAERRRIRQSWLKQQWSDNCWLGLEDEEMPRALRRGDEGQGFWRIHLGLSGAGPLYLLHGI